MKMTLAMALSLTAGLLATAPAGAQQLRFMTGPQGGSWYPLGGAIQAMAADDLGIAVQVLPGGGIANVQGVENGQADLGFANSISTVDAIKGREPFEAEAKNVCNVATLYPQYFQMVTTESSGIKSIEDLKGKRVATQPVGNTAEQVTRAVLQQAGMSNDDLGAVDYVSYSDGVALVQDNNSDVLTLGTTIPASSIMDLANSTDIMLIPLEQSFIDGMKADINPGYTGVTIPAGTYPGQDKDVLAVAYATHIVARCDLDPKTVEGILGEIWKNKDDLVAIAASMKGMTLDAMAQDIGVPMHEGAKAFYASNGGEQK